MFVSRSGGFPGWVGSHGGVQGARRRPDYPQPSKTLGADLKTILEPFVEFNELETAPQALIKLKVSSAMVDKLLCFKRPFDFVEPPIPRPNVEVAEIAAD